MATVPVLACRKCGQPVYVTHLVTTRPDGDASLLQELMKGLPKIALCKQHLEQYNWYAGQGRADEFLTNPEIIIYNVRDNTGVDYYGRES